MKSLRENFSYLMIAQCAYKILAFAAFILIARHLGAECFGQFSYALSFVAFFMLIADFGVSDLLVRDVAGELQDKGRRYISNISTLKIGLGFITILAIVIISLIFRESKDMTVIISLFGLAMILDSYAIFLKSIFRVFERMQYEAISILLEGLLKIGIVLVVVKIMAASILFFAAVFLLVSSIALLFTFILVKVKFTQIGLSFDFGFWKRLFIGGVPFSILIVFQVINFRIDVIMLSRITDNVIAGWYSVAARLIESTLIIPFAYVTSVFPVASRLAKITPRRLPHIYRTSFRILFLSSIMLIIFLYLGSDFFIPFLFGPEFAKSIIVVKILGFVLLPIFLRIFLDSFILALKRPNILLMIYVAGTLSNILLNFLLIPKYNFSGACIATILSESMMVTLYLVWINNALSQTLRAKDR